MIDILCQGKLTPVTRKALAQRGAESMPELAAAAEREALEKAIRPPPLARVGQSIKQFSNLAKRIVGSRQTEIAAAHSKKSEAPHGAPSAGLRMESRANKAPGDEPASGAGRQRAMPDRPRAGRRL